MCKPIDDGKQSKDGGNWIRIKDRPPPYDGIKKSFVLAYHTIHGIGVAWFWQFTDDDGIKEELEKDNGDTYLCSCQFIKNEADTDFEIDCEYSIDIFERSPHYKNVGTVTHWMPLPEPPIKDD